MRVKLYGIANCDTVKKAQAWFDLHGVEYAFHDYKRLGVDVDKLADWCNAHGWEVVLNRAGTTFKKLPDDEKANLDQVKSIALMTAQPSMIKRPIVEHDGKTIVGFKPEFYEKVFA